MLAFIYLCVLYTCFMTRIKIIIIIKSDDFETMSPPLVWHNDDVKYK